jgi:hypothetical protein
MDRSCLDKVSLIVSILLLIGLIAFHLILVILTHEESLMVFALTTDLIFGIANGILLIYLSFSNPGYLPRFITGNTVAEQRY